jgi:hypothetical protein
MVVVVEGIVVFSYCRCRTDAAAGESGSAQSLKVVSGGMAQQTLQIGLPALTSPSAVCAFWPALNLCGLRRAVTRR